MKLKLFIFVLFILPSIIYGKKASKYYPGKVDELDKMARKEKELPMTVSVIPTQNGFLADFKVQYRYHGFFYAGTIPGEIEGDLRRPVAIKFAKERFRLNFNTQIDIHHRLLAGRNEAGEEYGIPVVYSVGRDNRGFIMIALTNFDMNLQQASDLRPLTDLDILILLRDFVLQSKWMHADRNLLHHYINPQNIMIRGHRTFLFGFQSHLQAYSDYTLQFKCEKHGFRTAIDDYESFLYTISAVGPKKWFLRNMKEKKTSDHKEEKKKLGDSGLEKVIRAFADQVWPDAGEPNNLPDYEKLAKAINEGYKEIKTKIDNKVKIPANVNGNPPKFLWDSNDMEKSDKDFSKRLEILLTQKIPAPEKENWETPDSALIKELDKNPTVMNRFCNACFVVEQCLCPCCGDNNSM